MFRHRVWLLGSSLLGGAFLQARIVHYEKRDLQSHAVYEHEFVVQRDLVDGVLTEVWTVDEVNVDQEAYDKAFLAAHQAERTAECERERAQLREAADEIERIQRTAAQKLLVVQLDSLRHELKRIQDYDLDPHLIWSEETIASRLDYDQLIQTTLPEAEKARSNNAKKTGELSDLAAQLEDYVNRVHKLFLASVDHVITHTNDTKLLKRLMDLV